jgi:hypothetical protein
MRFGMVVGIDAIRRVDDAQPSKRLFILAVQLARNALICLISRRSREIRDNLTNSRQQRRGIYHNVESANVRCGTQVQMSASCQVEMSPFGGSQASLGSPFGALEAGHGLHTEGDDDDARTGPAEVRARGC